MLNSVFRGIARSNSIKQIASISTGISNASTPQPILRPRPSPQKPDDLQWNSVVKEAERVVGYPTSFLNLRWLLNDEIANVAMHMRKLVGTEHPLMDIAKNFMFKTDVPSWGLVVLLVSKIGGLKEETADLEFDKVAGILHSQRVLAEVTEMIRTSVVIHNALIEVDKSHKNIDSLNYGNKIALLSGDFLLSKSFHDLATLKNHEVNNIISSALRDLAEGEFLPPRDCNNLQRPAKPIADRTSDIFNEDNYNPGPYDVDKIMGNPRDEWVLRNILSSANLLAKACQAALCLGKHNEMEQKNGFLLGKHLALAWQAKIDVIKFETAEKFSLTSAPVFMHLAERPEFYSEISDLEKSVDYSKIKDIIKSGTAIADTKSLQNELTARALKNLRTFEMSSARQSLENLIEVL